MDHDQAMRPSGRSYLTVNKYSVNQPEITVLALQLLCDLFFDWTGLEQNNDQTGQDLLWLHPHRG